MNSPTPSLGPRGRGPAGGGWPEDVKRWPARDFRGRGSSCVHGEWRHCATSGRGAPGMGGERYAAATLWDPASGDSALFTGPGRPRSHPVRLTHLMGPVFHASGRSGAGRVREMALWEDRSAPHSSAVSWEPRNHEEIAGCARCVGPNDPPAAPEPEFDGVEERPRARRRGPIRPRSRPIRSPTRTDPPGIADPPLKGVPAGPGGPAASRSARRREPGPRPGRDRPRGEGR